MDIHLRSGASLFPPLKINATILPLIYLIKDFIGPEYRLLGGEVLQLSSRRIYMASLMTVTTKPKESCVGGDVISRG
jgi:hypothetical protein